MKQRKVIPVLAAAAVILIFIGIVSAAIYGGGIQITSAKRPADKYPGTAPVILCEGDVDGDGIKDQTDILEGALAYVQRCPKYKSKYYSSGYPDDVCGVCRDVVAFGLKSAGFDLQALVDQDIKTHPQDYAIDTPDANIDFRRVRNLSVFFENNGISLTLDIHQIEEWQGGDIVIFENHIGIVSDRRNEEGIPYVIHHNSPFQLNYEEDILEEREDITGHYRME